MTIKIYKDSTANAIFIEDANGAQFVNSLQAVENSGNINITDLAKQIDIVSNEVHTGFVDNNNDAYTGTASEVCNQLNSIFQTSGTPLTNLPEITSNLTINSVEGNGINYELIASYAVGYEWDLSNVSGITTVEGNVRKLVGGSSLTSGTYNIPVKAINYNGEDSQTIVLTVSTPPFSNTKSLQFNNQDYLGANASLLSSVLGRAGNGAGASDAWSISLYFKGSTANQAQTIFYFGDSDVVNGGYMQLIQVNSSGSKLLRLRYGSNNNRLQIQTGAGTISTSNWQNIIITYDGGTTGSSSADINDYYSRFKIYINNTLQATTNTNNNFGYTGSIDADNLRVGRFASGNYMRDNCKVDEISIWDSDQSSNSSDIYNSGVPFDLSTLTTQPKHWWRMGDGDTYPYLQDSGTEGNCVFEMNNMTSADIVNDVP
tara:strand:- start:73 stop:1362 length:1290 start_codon:yes stop_codon:yes gene_type:complete